MLIMMCACMLVCMSPLFVLIGYLGVFAFSNPNNDGWYGVINGEA